MQTEELTMMQASVEFNNSKRILTELKSERDQVKRKIEEAMQNDQIDLLSELSERIFELDEMELPLSELTTLEAGVRYWQAAMLWPNGLRNKDVLTLTAYSMLVSAALP